MLLRAISASDKLTQDVVNAMYRFAPILAFAEFYKIIGNADYTRKASGADGGEFRALDSDYGANQQAPAFANPQLKIFGDVVQVDQAHERRGADIASVRYRDLINFAQNLGQNFQYHLINADSATVTQFDGVKKIMPAGQVITAADDGLAVATGNGNNEKKAQQLFLELLAELMESVRGGAQVLMMDSKTINRLTSIARDQVQIVMNEFGKPITIYNGVPIIAGGFNSAGTLTIPHTEAVGTSGNVCTRVYALRFGDASDLSLASNVGVQVVDQGLVGAHWTHKVEFDVASALLNDKSIACLKGIIIS